MRERTQLGGWRGGGATSWAQREADRGVRKMGLGFESSDGAEVSVEGVRSLVEGKMASRWVDVASNMSSKVEREDKSMRGYTKWVDQLQFIRYKIRHVQQS